MNNAIARGEMENVPVVHPGSFVEVRGQELTRLLRCRAWRNALD